MSSISILEFKGVSAVAGGSWLSNSAPVPSCPPLASQTVAINQVTALSTAFNKETRLIRVFAPASCAIKFQDGDTDPVATTADMPMATNQTEFFGVAGGSKIAVIAYP